MAAAAASTKRSPAAWKLRGRTERGAAGGLSRSGGGFSAQVSDPGPQMEPRADAVHMSFQFAEVLSLWREKNLFLDTRWPLRWLSHHSNEVGHPESFFKLHSIEKM